MFYSASQVEVCLQRRNVLRLQDAAGAVVQVLSGSIWITQEREPGDMVLGRGERFVVTRPGNTVVSALKDSRVVVIPVQAGIAETKKGLRNPQPLHLSGAPGRI